MYHTFPPAASFWPFLLTIDQDLAETTRRHGCPCGGRLHRSNYPRKPRGDCDTLSDTYNTRFSFCCDRDGCRKRSTAPSVRFFGRNGTGHRISAISEHSVSATVGVLVLV
jgi:hypothetical protein